MHSRQIQNTQKAKSNIDEIQKQLAQSKKVKTIDDEIDEVVMSKNEGLKEKKIRELVQKNKSLQVSYEKEKACRQKLEQQLQKIQKETDDKLQQLEQSNNMNRSQRPSSASKTQNQSQLNPLVKALKGKDAMPPKKEDTYEELKIKYKEADKKVQELRVQVQSAKNELNKATRVIQREIGGDNINLDQLLLEENQWKGRAQQIEKLKAKVRLHPCINFLFTLKKMLHIYRELQQRVSTSSQFSMTSESSQLSNTQNSTFSQKSEVKRQVFEQQKQQLDALKQENELLQSKVKAVTSRKQILEAEIKEIKFEYDKNKKIFLDKSDNDDKYITYLKQELEKQKRNTQSIETRIVYKTKEVDEESNLKQDQDQSLEVKKLKQEIIILKEEIKRNEAMVKELIDDKIKIPKGDSNLIEQTTIPQSKILTEKIKKLEDEIKVYRKERDEFFKQFSKDSDSQKTIKDLSLQNVKLRTKIDDLEHKLKQ